MHIPVTYSTTEFDIPVVVGPVLSVSLFCPMDVPEKTRKQFPTATWFLVFDGDISEVDKIEQAMRREMISFARDEVDGAAVFAGKGEI